MLNVRVNVLSTELHLIGTATAQLRMHAGRGYVVSDAMRINVIEDGYIHGAIGIVEELEMTFQLSIPEIKQKAYAGNTITLAFPGPIFIITQDFEKQSLGLN